MGGPLFASTNWGAESGIVAKARYQFLNWFDGAPVPGEVGVAEPDPALFTPLESRFELHPPHTLYTSLVTGSWTCPRRDPVDGWEQIASHVGG